MKFELFRLKGDQWVGIWSVLCMILFTVAFCLKWLEAMQTVAGLVGTVLSGYVAYTTISKTVGSYLTSKAKPEAVE